MLISKIDRRTLQLRQMFKWSSIHEVWHWNRYYNMSRYEILWRYVVAIYMVIHCTLRGHQFKLMDSIANAETAYQDWECIRCGASDRVTYY